MSIFKINYGHFQHMGRPTDSNFQRHREKLRPLSAVRFRCFVNNLEVFL